MTRFLAILLSVVLAALAGFDVGQPFVAQQARAQQFPASAVIRGENIRLRAEPAENTDDIAILQRGDQITITGEVTTAEGLEFYPVELAATGDAGWVRDLFIDPKSIVPLDVAALEPAPEAEPEPAPEPEEEAENGRRERPARNERRNRNADEEPAAAEEQAPEEEPAEEAAPEDEAAAEDEPAAEGATASVSGEGATATDPFALEAGRYRVTASMETSDATAFTCNLLGPDNFTETLFDEEIDSAQSWTARTALTLENGGEYVVECVNTEEAWTIDFVLRGA